MSSKLGWATAVILLAVGGYFLNRSMLNERRLQEQLLTSLSEIDRSNEELAKLKAAQVETDELDRLRADQHEALKLRGEVTRLKHDLARAQSVAKAAKANESAASNGSTNEPAILKTDPLPVDNPDVAVHQTQVIQAELPSSGVLAVGGWESVSGKRVFAFMQPTQDKLNGNQVGIATYWVEMNADAAKNLRIGGFLDASGDQFTTFDSDTFKQLKEDVEKTSGMSLLSAPMVTTVSGRQARVSVTESRDTAGGKVEFGPNVDVIPAVAEDGSAIKVTMKASLVESRQAPTN